MAKRRRGSRERKITRSSSKIDLKAVFWIYCEGKTETLYLSALERALKPPVRLELHAECGSPRTIVELGTEKVRELTPRNPLKAQHPGPSLGDVRP